MNTKQEHIYYWCRGSKENPEGVLKALTEKGAEHNYKAIKGKDEDLLYYINLNNEVKCCRINSEHADLIMRCGIELQPIENRTYFHSAEPLYHETKVFGWVAFNFNKVIIYANRSNETKVELGYDNHDTWFHEEFDYGDGQFWRTLLNEKELKPGCYDMELSIKLYSDKDGPMLPCNSYDF